MYREYRAPGPLAPFVECLWRRDLTEDEVEDRGVVLPDGRIDLVWVGGGEPLVAGPQTRFVPRPLAPPYVAVGARFHPSVGPALLRRVAPAAPGPARARGRRGGHRSRRGPVVRRCRPARPGRARGRPSAGWAAVAVEQVAHQVGFSERELRRRFRASIGYGPKTLQRVLRFQRVLAWLSDGPPPDEPLARLAMSAGYSDQAHMTRETRELAGITPAQLAQSA